MASATSSVAPVKISEKQGKASSKSVQKYYVTDVTTLGDGSVMRETYSTDAKGNNKQKVQEVRVDKDGNITKDEISPGVSEGERKALKDPNSQLRQSIRTQTKDAGDAVQKNEAEAAAGGLTSIGKKNQEVVAGGSGNTATGSGEEKSQPSAEPSKPAPGVNEGIKGMDARYPEDIGGTKQDVIKFDMLEYRPSKFEDRPAVDTASVIGSVFLAVPGGIQDQSSANWTGESMDPIQKRLASAAFNLIGKSDTGQAISDEIGQLKSEIEKGGGEMKQMIQGIFAGKAAGVGNQIFQRGQGQIMNPNMELLFNGPSLRQFSFNFLLAPRSKKEQDQVVNIIRFFKQGMSPIKSEANLFLKSPNTFRLRYIHRKSGEDSEHKFLTKFKECALISTGVNYTPNTNYATFPDGGMVAYQLALTFQELEPIFNNDYAKVEEGSIGY